MSGIGRRKRDIFVQPKRQCKPDLIGAVVVTHTQLTEPSLPTLQHPGSSPAISKFY